MFGAPKNPTLHPFFALFWHNMRKVGSKHNILVHLGVLAPLCTSHTQLSNFFGSFCRFYIFCSCPFSMGTFLGPKMASHGSKIATWLAIASCPIVGVYLWVMVELTKSILFLLMHMNTTWSGPSLALVMSFCIMHQQPAYDLANHVCKQACCEGPLSPCHDLVYIQIPPQVIKCEDFLWHFQHS